MENENCKLFVAAGIIMRRPLCYAAGAFAFEIMIFYFSGAETAGFMILLCMAAAVVIYIGAARLMNDCSIEKKKRFFNMASIVLVSLICSFFNMYGYMEDQYDIEDSLDDIMKIYGTVMQRSEKTSSSGKEYLQYRVSVSEVNGNDFKGKLNLIVNDYRDESSNDTEDNVNIIPGEKIYAEGECEKASGRRNPGCFDYARHLSSLGIAGIMTGTVSEQYDNSGSGTGINIRGWLYNMRCEMIRYIEKYSDTQTAALVSGIMFGDKSLIGEETLESFQKNGTAHILAVSGIHAGMIYSFLSFLWRWKKGKLFFVLMSLFFICYVVLADFSPSVVRAVFMIETHIFASVTNRRYDLNSAAFFAALISMINNPMQIFHAGFQMSYLAVLTLSLILPYIHRFYTGVLSAGIAVQIGLLPYIMYVFNYLSVISVFINVPVILLAGFIVPLGIVSAVLTVLCSPIMTLTSPVLSILCKSLIWMNDMTCIDGLTVFEVTSPDIKFLAIYYICVFLFLSETGRMLFIKREKKVLLMCLTMAIFAVQLTGMCFHNDFKDADIVFVDVGQGDCMHLRSSGGGNYIIDGGGSVDYNIGQKTLKPYFLKNGVRKLDGAFVTHLHTDHYKGIAELCREGMVKKLYVYEGNQAKEQQIMDETGMDSSDIIYLRKGCSAVLSDDTCIDVIWPEKPQNNSYYADGDSEDEDENSVSLIMRVVHKGKTILMTGDIDTECHEKLSAMYQSQLKTDILKAAHHGSKYSFSDSFTDFADPEAVVFQVGKNNYGHPDSGVIEEYERRNIRTFRNDIDGAVGFKWNKKGKIQTMTVIEYQQEKY